ncbi:MAG: hypothetical protein J0L70_06300 [Leptolyngbya sp. UWPOB_LEPTO1]|uniref:hypothetical protein n=1 Tax=Leptolyngbya sp. UWPOB_LEPTO1 TaxID=2815653 RepID=UPI001AC12FE2|nr:hypothetical protein [Leptolyngbya sp. UWPOB_LEPTO1]MBN8560115.1 hypothetical protein [Leptolyngbya sp. UWPOB_LEPTO1]
MTLSLDLEDYQALRRSHQAQIEPRLAQLSQTITQQIQTLEAEEHGFIEPSAAAIAQLQSRIAPDVRCVLDEVAFRAQMTNGFSTGSRLASDKPELSTDLDTWVLHDLPFPVVLMEHQADVDDWAYNDENHYTEYRYELVVQIGSWTKSIGAAIAQLSPGNPIDYRRCEFEQQQYELAYQLKPTQRWNEPPVPQFTGLDWSIEQQEQLRQELSCVLAFVGDLLTLHPLVATFRYPMRRSIA